MAASDPVHGGGDPQEVLDELEGHVLVGGGAGRELEGDLQHVLAEQRHPRGAVGLLQEAAGRERGAPVEHADVVEAEEPALEDVAAARVLAVHPPGEVHEQLLEGVAQELGTVVIVLKSHLAEFARIVGEVDRGPAALVAEGVRQRRVTPIGEGILLTPRIVQAKPRHPGSREAPDYLRIHAPVAQGSLAVDLSATREDRGRIVAPPQGLRLPTDEGPPLVVSKRLPLEVEVRPVNLRLGVHVRGVWTEEGRNPRDDGDRLARVERRLEPKEVDYVGQALDGRGRAPNARLQSLSGPIGVGRRWTQRAGVARGNSRDSQPPGWPERRSDGL